MPKAARHPCRHPGCHNLADAGNPYCIEHQADKAQHYATYNASRPERHEVYRSQRWRRLAAMQLRREPLCRMCSARGVIKTAEVADHVCELEDGGAPYDPSNLQSLCRACHNAKSAAERARRAGRG